MLPQIHLMSAPNSGIFYVKGRKEGWSKRWVRTTGQLGADQDPRKSAKALNLIVPLVQSVDLR